jgi:hypothetical protein
MIPICLIERGEAAHKTCAYERVGDENTQNENCEKYTHSKGGALLHTLLLISLSRISFSLVLIGCNTLSPKNILTMLHWAADRLVH